MEQKQEPQRPKIGTEEVRRAADILRRYHAGKRQLEQRADRCLRLALIPVLPTGQDFRAFADQRRAV